MKEAAELRRDAEHDEVVARHLLAGDRLRIAKTGDVSQAKAGSEDSAVAFEASRQAALAADFKPSELRSTIHRWAARRSDGHRSAATSRPAFSAVPQAMNILSGLLTTIVQIFGAQEDVSRNGIHAGRLHPKLRTERRWLRTLS
jgi:hypothetical protein